MSDAAFVFSPKYEADIGPHVFPTEKYRLVRDEILKQGLVPPEAFTEPVPRGREVLRLAHRERYLDDLFALRRTRGTEFSELPLTEEIVRWFETAVFGTMTTVDLALRRGAALHVGGGFHHAFPDHAEGFCYLNDTAVAARYALGVDDGVPLTDAAGRDVVSVTVVDLDLHQGNGTAFIFRDDERVFTFSMHQENNYPPKQESDLDIGLPDGADDDLYLSELDRALEEAVLSRAPQLVFYLAGADPYEEDQLGGLAVSREGLRLRDQAVFSACEDVGASVAVLLAGGYAARLEDTVAIHVQTAEEMLRFRPWS